jgi:uncharacterized membrane protein required for colicin V production
MNIQTLDIVLVLIWAACVAWGWVTGAIRNVGYLAGTYVAAGAAGVLYARLGNVLKAMDPLVEAGGNDVIAWAFIFFLVIILFIVLLFVAYPHASLGRNKVLDHILGAVLSAIWGVFFVIAIITILREYSVVAWPGQLESQQSMKIEMSQSVVAHVIAYNLTPAWLAMSPWFPSDISYTLA